MLENIFGNETAEKVLLHIYHYGEIHASAISLDYNISVTPVLNQLVRFENAGVLVSKQIGRSRVFMFNKKSPFTKPTIALLKIVYENISLDEKQQFFKRRRPRKKGKPVL